MLRREFLQGVGATAAMGATLSCSRVPFNKNYVTETRIAFGSCADQNRPQPIWETVLAKKPDVFVLLGDNVYADTEDMDLMSAQYAKLASQPGFIKLRERIPILATWDDHDYGCNDSGCEYPMRELSKRIMLDFFNEPKHSPRREREGVYQSYNLKFGEHTLQIILLDLRWFRSRLEGSAQGYLPSQDPVGLLGEIQWKWLESELRKPASYRLIGSSIQFISSEHQWEKWANFPIERDRLLRLIEELNLRNVMFLSGDMHFGEVSKQTLRNGYELLDITASGLNRAEPAGDIHNPHRVDIFDREDLFGMVTLNWENKKVRAEIVDVNGNSPIVY